MPSVLSDTRRAHSPVPDTAPSGGVAAAIIGVGQNLLNGSRSTNGTSTNGISTNGISQPMSVSSPVSVHLPNLDGMDLTSQVEELTSHLEKQRRIKDGAENMLQVVEASPTDVKLRTSVENELSTANAKITAMTKMITQLKESADFPRVPRKANGMNGTTSISGKRSFFTPAAEKVRYPQPTEQEDYKTALNLAKGYLSNLLSYGRQPRAPHEAASVAGSLAGSGMTAMDEEVNRGRIANMARLIDVLQRNMRVRYDLDVEELIQAVIPALSDYATKESRAIAYRLLRHVVLDANTVTLLRNEGLDWYMLKSLARDNKFVEEKEQVVKFIRSLMELRLTTPATEPNGHATTSVPVSEPAMRALVAVAEHGDDQLRLACLETVAEMVLIDIDLVCSTGGMRVLLQALVDGPPELAPALASVFLFLIDMPHTRSYLKLGWDLEIAFSGFTDVYGKGSVNLDRMRASARILSCVLRNWSGLLYFSLDGKRAIVSLIDTLRLPFAESREMLLNLFFEILNIRLPRWHNEYISGRRLTMYGRELLVPGQAEDPVDTEPPPINLNLTDHYIALVALILVDAGLLDALIAVVQEKDGVPGVGRKAALLLGEILQLVNRVLPSHVAGSIQSLPQLFTAAADYDESDKRSRGAAALSSIDSLNRNKGRLEISPTKDNRNRANSMEDAIRRGQRQVEQTKIKMAMQVDDKTFQGYIVESQVNANRDFTKWNFDILIDLVEGPLMNPKRLEEMIRTSKFGRRLMSFFHPFSHRFSDIARTKANQKYVRLGCSLITALVSQPEGQRFLATDDKLLRELMECFAQLDPFNGTPATDPIFSKKRVEETLTYGYFEMLGNLSKTSEGIELLERFKIFTAFYHLSELKSREDLIKGIIENLDYSIDGHPRIVLSKALTSSYKHIRLYATEHLGQLIQASPKANEWTIRLLLTQLYDSATEVRELAVHFVEEACQSPEILEMVVGMQPTLEHLGEIGHPLLLRFMATQTGFRYLCDAKYIDREMDGWFHERNYQYVIQVEAFLSRAFSQPVGQEDVPCSFEGFAPPHFYGEMAKTELGCEVLLEKGHFAEFTQFILQHGLESKDRELIAKLKSVLWAVGHIGSQKAGFLFVERAEILQPIIDIAEQSKVLSVRGTCYFVLGLLSSTAEGADILYEYGWEATKTLFDQPTGICIPSSVGDKMEKFLDIPLWETPPRINFKPEKLRPPTVQREQDILLAVTNLSNTILANAASRTLAKIKTRHRRIFSSLSLYYRILHILSGHMYRLPVRRYILEVFDVKLDPTTIAALRKVAIALKEEGGSPSDDQTAFVSRNPRNSVRVRARQRSMSDEEDLVSFAGSDDGGDDEDGIPRQRLEPQHRIEGGFDSD